MFLILNIINLKTIKDTKVIAGEITRSIKQMLNINRLNTNVPFIILTTSDPKFSTNDNYKI